MEQDKWYNKSGLEIAPESVNGFEAESRCMKGSDLVRPFGNVTRPRHVA